MEKILIGVSRCLLGEAVRHYGGHAWDRYVTETLGQYVEFVPVCPEMEAGFGVPREPVHLVGDPASPRLMTVKTKKDLTDTMTAWARRRVRELEKENLCGFIFKSKSPSSGMERVDVYTEEGMPVKKGVGLFARAFMEHFPLIPVEEEGRLHDPHLRENLIERIFILNRWREVLQERRSLGNLVRFHTGNKLLLLSHSQKHYRAMGQWVAHGKESGVKERYAQYETMLLSAIQLKTTVKKNVNVLQHMMGYFKKQLSSDEKQELLDVIFDYRAGLIPLIVPLTLFKHYVRKYEEPYLSLQTYLHPHPTALKLRNHV